MEASVPMPCLSIKSINSCSLKKGGGAVSSSTIATVFCTRRMRCPLYTLLLHGGWFSVNLSIRNDCANAKPGSFTTFHWYLKVTDDGPPLSFFPFSFPFPFPFGFTFPFPPPLPFLFPFPPPSHTSTIAVCSWYFKSPNKLAKKCVHTIR